ncbi:MAG: sel1 repeat family protein, partial [Akkermansia sp.]|nr:sel1 repeat family protein [Akkermansia sp.]
RLASDANLPEAQYRLAMLLLQEDTAETQPEALDLLARAAAGKSLHTAALAARSLGNIYAKGQAGVTPDMRQAATWYRQAARGGDARSQLVYAIMLLDGEWVQKDEKQGMAMLRMASGQDYPQAIALLVNLLRNAPNAADNEAEAAAWAERLDSLRKK